MTKSKTAYEKYLNDFYKNEVNIDTAINALIYLQSKKYCMKMAERKTKHMIINGRAGSVLRLRDPIAFNVGYNEWNP